MLNTQMQLHIGQKYITDHNTPITITELKKNARGELVQVWARWPSGRNCQVNTPGKSIIRIFALNEGDQVAFSRYGDFYKVVSVDMDSQMFKTNNSSDWKSFEQIGKIIKRQIKLGDIIIPHSDVYNEYKVVELFDLREMRPYLRVSQVRHRHVGAPETFEPLPHGATNLFFFDQVSLTNPPRRYRGSSVVEDVIAGFRTGESMEKIAERIKNKVDLYQYHLAADSPFKELQFASGQRITCRKPTDDELVAHQAMLRSKRISGLEPVFTEKFERRIDLGIDFGNDSKWKDVREAMAELAKIAKEYNVSIITGEQKMDVGKFDKENRQAGKADALEKKKAYEREQSEAAYTKLLNALGQIEHQIKILEGERDAIKKEMAKFD